MTVSDIELEMKLNGVSAEDIAAILKVCKTKGYGLTTLDEELEKRGYEKVFTVNYDDDDDDWDDEEDDFAPIERFPHKHRFDDDWKR